jgi:uncharacterized protein YggE
MPMTRTLILTICLTLCVIPVAAQEAGSSVYGTGGRPRKPQLNSGELAGAVNQNQAQFIEASVLMNLQPDAFVAVFGYVQEGSDPAAGNALVNAKFADFIKSLESLGVKRSDIYVDYISQNRIFDYTETGNTITEKLAGFETKKNIAVRYTDRAMLEKLLSAAAKSSIFDLIEVDYVVNDLAAARSRLFQDAVKTIKRKEAAYTESFGLRITPYALANEKYDAFFPGEQYRGYQAYEAGTTYNSYNKTVIRPRKVATFYYEPLNAADFDTVINPIGIEPVVQLTLYLKMQYDLPRTVTK